MIPLVFTIPEEADDLFPWLDSIIVGPGFRQFVGELNQVRHVSKETADIVSARNWTGENLGSLLENGTASLGEDRIRELLQWPNMLVAVQELVLLDGGEYWQRKLDNASDIQERSDELRNKIIKPLEPAKNTSSTPNNLRLSWAYRFGGIAALLLVGVFLVSQAPEKQQQELPKPNGTQPPSQLMRGDGDQPNESGNNNETISWNWTRINSKEIDTRDEQLKYFADTLDNWFDVTKNITSLQELSLSLSELWLGCELVISMPLQSLEEQDKSSLRTSMTNLQQQATDIIEEINREINASSPKQGRFSSIKQKADEIVRKSIEDIRRLSDTPS